MNGIEIIDKYEAALRDAMLENDVGTLNELIDDDLIFTAPDGQVLSKDDDLTMHRARLLRLNQLDVYETRSQCVGEMVVTFTKAQLAGHFGTTPISGAFAYTRLWRSAGKHWRIIAGHASRID